MLKVGLSGGIACGKSYTLDQFRKLGAFTLDADKIAHHLLQPGQLGYQKVVEVFGSSYLTADLTIDRQKLGRLVFSDAEARQRLNRIVHPLVFEEEKRQIAEAESTHRGAPLILVDAALMVETGSFQNYQVILMLYCKPDVQLTRLMLRDKLPPHEARQRINSQMPILEKVKYGDYIIENSGKLSHTREQVEYVFKDLLFRYGENDFQETWRRKT